MLGVLVLHEDKSINSPKVVIVRQAGFIRLVCGLSVDAQPKFS